MAWWDIYFDELYVRMFKVILTPERTTEELNGVVAFLDLAPGARILDLACGHGRHSIPLAQAGYRVIGLDRSAYMLKRGREAAAEAMGGAAACGERVEWVRGDMRHLPFAACWLSGGSFDACINLFTSFGYFEDESENEQVVAEAARLLRPGGKFLIDVSNRDYYLLRMWPASWRHHGPAIILEQTAFDPETCRFHSTFTWLEGERRESLAHSVRYYTVPELKGMLRRAGLEPVGVYGDFDGGPFTLDSKRMIIVAQKPE
ncbi:MAG: class I SAM-dependent methyltransferase [Anaerolineae bacterium]|nr:class I SAM-dependent methyltransferase [Anaerolineae bacterium]